MPRDERLSQAELHAALVKSLGSSVDSSGDLEEKPLNIILRPPFPRFVRAYVYNATRPPGGRTMGEHKIQLIVPGQPRGERGNFDDADGHFILLVGIEPHLGVTVFWDAGLYRDFSYSRNVQVKGETIYRALGSDIARQERALRTTSGTAREIVLAATEDRVCDALLLRMRLTYDRLVGG